jgi:hypothetical protein
VALTLQHSAGGTEAEAEAWVHHERALEILLLVERDTKGAESYATLGVPSVSTLGVPSVSTLGVPTHELLKGAESYATTLSAPHCPRTTTNSPHLLAWSGSKRDVGSEHGTLGDPSGDTSEDTVRRLLLLLLNILLTRGGRLDADSSHEHEGGERETHAHLQEERASTTGAETEAGDDTNEIQNVKRDPVSVKGDLASVKRDPIIVKGDYSNEIQVVEGKFLLRDSAQGAGGAGAGAGSHRMCNVTQRGVMCNVPKRGVICNVTKRGVISLRPVPVNSLDANDSLLLQHSLHSLHSQMISSSQSALDGAHVDSMTLELERNTKEHQGTPSARRPGDDYYEELEKASQRLGPGQARLQEALHDSMRARHATPTQEGATVRLAECALNSSEPSKEAYSSNTNEPSKETCHRGKRDLLRRQQGAEWAADEALRLVGRHRNLLLSHPLLLLQSVPQQCALNTALPLLSWSVLASFFCFQLLLFCVLARSGLSWKLKHTHNTQH